MRNKSKWFTWAMCMALSADWAYAAETAATNTADSYEASKITAGLNKLGIGDGYQIVVAEDCDLVENTAAQMMQRFLAKASLSVAIVTESQAAGDKRIFLGQESDLAALKALGDSKDINIRDVSAEDDGFHLKQVGDDIVVAGANPRAVLYGVYAFEDFVNDGAAGKLDIRKVPYFRKRGTGLHYTDVIFNAELEAFPEEKAIYLSRLGINQMTDQGIGGTFGKFVKSDIFSFAEPPVRQFQQRAKEMMATCKRFGIDAYIFLVEPTLEPLADGFDSYPEEALGTVRPPWGGDEKTGLKRTLCVNSPLAQDYLREMMQKLVREYPDLKGIQLYNLDAGSWLCTPELCERCKTVATHSPDAFNPPETQAKLVTLLSEAAHAARPDFELKFWSTVHYHGDRFDEMMRLADGYDGLMSAWTGSDRPLMVPDAAARTATCVASQEIAKERDVPFYMMCEMNNLEVIPKSLSFPFHAAEALQKYKEWNATNITEIFGMAPEHDTINALVTKAFEWEPDQNIEAVLKDLSRRQFGETAGELVYQSWQEMRKAYDIWDDQEDPPFPLIGSQFHTKFGISIGGLGPAILPDMVEYYDSTIQILTNVEPWLAEGYQEHKSQEFLDKMLAMNAHFAQAAELAKKAIDAASSEQFVGISYFESADGRPTCKQYAELHYAPIAIVSALCSQRCDIIRAYHILSAMNSAREAGDDAAAKKNEQQYHELVREDIVLLEQFCDLLTEFSQMQPCYTRTSLTEQEIAGHLAFTQAKIEKLKALLADAVPVAGAADDSHQELAMITKP